MNKIELFCMGDLKFKGLKELEKMYADKINYFTKFGIRSLKDVKVKDEAARKKKEGIAFLDALDKKDLVIALDQYGKKMDSPQFAELLTRHLESHQDRIVFIIGGHSGLAPELEPRITMKLSFSDMVFAHDVFRIVFLEQLYRAFTIIKKINYHR